METTPSLKACEFAKLDPGDLFALNRGNGSYVALAVKDPNADEKMAVVLGPASSEAPRVPRLLSVSPQTRVVSFGKDYKLRLPCDANAWLFAEPAAECACLVLAEDKLYIRALLALGGLQTQCYIGVEDGVVLGSAARFAQPRGDCAYTVDWGFFTTEENPRKILFSPHLDEVERRDSTTKG